MTSLERTFVGTDAENEASVQRGLLGKVGTILGNLPLVHDTVTMFYCANDPDTPTSVKAALFGALAYFVAPIDLIPDSIPVVGYVDDAAVIAGALTLFGGYIKEGHRRRARELF